MWSFRFDSYTGERQRDGGMGFLGKREGGKGVLGLVHRRARGKRGGRKELGVGFVWFGFRFDT